MKRVKKARTACMQCKRAHLSCSDFRPCERCVTKHIGHLCDDTTCNPQPVPLSSDEMRTMCNILGTESFEFFKGPDEFDVFKATDELDYTNIFVQSAETYSQKKRAISTRASPNLPTTNKIVHIPQTNGNSTMVHGIVVNSPPPSFQASQPTIVMVPNPLRNVAVVRSFASDDDDSQSPPSTFDPIANSPYAKDPSTFPLVDPLSTIDNIKALQIDAVATALSLHNEQLKQKVNDLEIVQSKLQRALDERDQQLKEMQSRNSQEHAKLKILIQCQFIPQALDLSLIHKSKTYGVMTALYDTSNGALLDYNKNFGKMLTDVFGPDHEQLPLRWLPGPMEPNAVVVLIDMMIKDYFKETLEKYTYIFTFD